MIYGHKTCFLQKSFLGFEKWTKINVHFLILKKSFVKFIVVFLNEYRKTESDLSIRSQLEAYYYARRNTENLQ